MEGRNCTSMRDFYEVMEKDNSRKTEEEKGGKVHRLWRRRRTKKEKEEYIQTSQFASCIVVANQR